MKLIFLILNSKIVRIAATIALIFYLFHSTKNNPNSISSQLSGDNLKKNIGVIKNVVGGH